MFKHGEIFGSDHEWIVRDFDKVPIYPTSLYVCKICGIESDLIIIQKPPKNWTDKYIV